MSKQALLERVVKDEDADAFTALFTSVTPEDFEKGGELYGL